MDEIPKNYESFDINDNERGNTKRDVKPLIAGIILIIAGFMAILTWISVFAIDFTILDLSMLETQNVTITPEQLDSLISICGTIGIILSLFPILGGILAIQKKLWGGALAGSIIGLFTIGPAFLSSILSLICLILLIISKDQFNGSNDSITEY